MARWCQLCQLVSDDEQCKGKRAVSVNPVTLTPGIRPTPTLVDVVLRTCGATTVAVRDVYQDGKKIEGKVKP
jgi:predicted RNA-binding protein with PUA domain